MPKQIYKYALKPESAKKLFRKSEILWLLEHSYKPLQVSFKKLT